MLFCIWKLSTLEQEVGIWIKQSAVLSLVHHSAICNINLHSTYPSTFIRYSIKVIHSSIKPNLNDSGVLTTCYYQGNKVYITKSNVEWDQSFLTVREPINGRSVRYRTYVPRCGWVADIIIKRDHFLHTFVRTFSAISDRLRHNSYYSSQ